MTGNDRGRSVNPPNFWSFNFIDVKGLPLQFGSKTFTGFKIADLESLDLSKNPLFYYIKGVKNYNFNFQDLQFQNQ